MSKITIRAQSLQKIKPDTIPKTVDELIKDITNSQLNDEDTEILCNAALPLIENPLPATSRAGFKLCNVLLELNTPKSFKDQLMKKLKVPLSTKGPTSDSAVELAQKIIGEVSPNSFFEKYISQIPNCKTPPLKISVLKLFLNTINTYPDFKTKHFLSTILNCTTDNNPEVRKLSLEIIGIIYNRNPTSMTKFIKNQFPSNFSEIISKLAGKTPQKTETFAELSTVADITTKDIEKQTIQEFINPLPDIQPDKRPCQFDIINKQLSRETDWSERMEALTKLVAHARGFADKRSYASDFRKADNFLNCVLDARSTLAKHASLCLAAIAKAIGPSFDINTASLVTGIFSRTNHSALIISLSAELSILKYVEYVWGKNIKSVIMNCCNVESAHSRLTAAKAMIIAAEKWPQEMTKDFSSILQRMSKDKSDIVRDFISKQLTSNGEIIFLKYCQSVETETEENITKPLTPILRKNHEPTPVLQKTTKIVTEADEKLSLFLKRKDIESIVSLLQSSDEKVNINNFVNDLADYVIVEMNEVDDKEISITFIRALLTKYSRQFSLKLPEFIRELPDDPSRGVEYIKIFYQVYDKSEVTKHLLTSTMIYPYKYCVNMAINDSNDVDFSVKVVQNVVKAGFIKELQKELSSIVKNISSRAKTAAEALIGSIPINSRQAFLDTICSDIPFLKNTFANEEISSQLVAKIRVMVGSADIDMNLLAEAFESGKDDEKLIAIAAIREHPVFDPLFVPFLVSCITDSQNPSVSGAAANALHKRCDGNDGVCLHFAHLLQPDRNQLNAFAKTLVKASEDEAKQAIQIATGVILGSISSHKFAALSCIAATIVKLGEESASVFGSFDEMDQRLIHVLLPIVMKQSIL